MTVIEEERYKRQTLLWGQAGQDKLAQARVAVIGLGYQGVYTALCLTSLGVGNLVLIDGKEAQPQEMFLDMHVPSGSRARSYPGLFKKINPQVQVEGYVANLSSSIDQLVLEGATAIVDATNSLRSKQFAVNFSREKGIPMLSTSSHFGYTKMIFCQGGKESAYLMPMFDGQEQDELMALAMCGPVTEEVRKIIFGEIDKLSQEPLRFNLGKGYRFGFPSSTEKITLPDPQVYSSLKVAFLGGGALGCWGALAGAKMGFARLDVFDYDRFESHNINRQVLAYDGIGELKASHIASKIKKISRGQTESTGHNVMIMPGFTTDIAYDLVFDFVDNRYTRAVNSAYAINYHVPLISAGALPSSARWDVHVAGKTQCMDCLYNIYEEGRKEEMIRRASCAANPNPSVVMANAIGAVQALLNAYTIFEPQKFGEPFNGEQTYRDSSAKRFGTSPLARPCDCYSMPAPDLEISPEELEKFIAANPQLLQQE